MANTWKVVSGDQVGAQPIGDTSTTAKHPLGTIVKARSDDFGEGEFIYLKGVGSTVVGSVVYYSGSTWTTTLATVGNASSRPIAVAMSANVANQYGWYQISGYATVRKTTATSFAAGISLGTTAGAVIAAATSNAIAGCIVATIATGSARGTMEVVINRPHMSET